jgi:hypothetical protein
LISMPWTESDRSQELNTLKHVAIAKQRWPSIRSYMAAMQVFQEKAFSPLYVDNALSIHEIGVHFAATIMVDRALGMVMLAQKGYLLCWLVTEDRSAAHSFSLFSPFRTKDSSVHVPDCNVSGQRAIPASTPDRYQFFHFLWGCVLA